MQTDEPDLDRWPRAAKGTRPRGQIVCAHARRGACKESDGRAMERIDQRQRPERIDSQRLFVRHGVGESDGVGRDVHLVSEGLPWMGRL